MTAPVKPHLEIIMKKKFLSILLVFLLIFTMPVASFAAGLNKIKLTVDSLDVSPGETFDVRIKLDNNPGIVSANLKVEFDEGLTLVGATNGDVFSTLTYIPPKQLTSGKHITSSCQFAWMGFDIADKDIKNGTILTLSFKVTETAKAGDTYNISVYNDKGNVIDRELNEISLSAQGTIEIITENDDQNTSTMQSIIQKIMNFFRIIIEKIRSIFSNNE